MVDWRLPDLTKLATTRVVTNLKPEDKQTITIFLKITLYLKKLATTRVVTKFLSYNNKNTHFLNLRFKMIKSAIVFLIDDKVGDYPGSHQLEI